MSSCCSSLRAQLLQGACSRLPSRLGERRAALGRQVQRALLRLVAVGLLALDHAARQDALHARLVRGARAAAAGHDAQSLPRTAPRRRRPTQAARALARSRCRHVPLVRAARHAHALAHAHSIAGLSHDKKIAGVGARARVSRAAGGPDARALGGRSAGRRLRRRAAARWPPAPETYLRTARGRVRRRPHKARRCVASMRCGRGVVGLAAGTHTRRRHVLAAAGG
eukprot:6193671-Pleurochrysis_carterae.AAC.1